MEEWRPVVDYEGLYEVSNTGKIRIKENNGQNCKEISTAVLQRGYPTVILNKDGVKIREKVYRIVAKAFLPNPLNKKIVKHKNKIKTDDNADNLEWVTDTESKCGIYKRCHIRARKPILQIKDGIVVNEHESIIAAGQSIVQEYKRMGFPITMTPEKNIVNAVKNGKYAYGYTWEYKDKRTK